MKKCEFLLNSELTAEYSDSKNVIRVDQLILVYSFYEFFSAYYVQKFSCSESVKVETSVQITQDVFFKIN